MFSRIATFIVCGAAASAVLAGSSVIDSGRAAVGGVVAEYAFDEGTGTLLHDASGNHNDGTIASASWTTGHSGTALSFNGSSSIVTVPGTSVISPTTAVTIEAWVKPATTAGWRAIAVKEQTPSALSYGLYSSSDAGPASLVYTSSEQDLKGASRIPVGAWSYLAAVYDGSVNRVYVNGSLVAQSAVSGSIAESGGALRIGGDTIWNEWFNGSIDDLRIYSRVLTAAEINSDMTTAVPSSAPNRERYNSAEHASQRVRDSFNPGEHFARLVGVVRQRRRRGLRGVSRDVSGGLDGVDVVHERWLGLRDELQLLGRCIRRGWQPFG